MQFRKICDDVKDMSMTEMAHNHVFVRDGEAWYRDFTREISVRNLMREICTRYASPADAEDLDNDTLDELLFDNLSYGTEELEGVFALLYMTMWGMADVRAWLEQYEKYGLPTTNQPEVLQRAIDIYGKEAQVDMAIEEMSELTKALLKFRRSEHSATATAGEKARKDILEETADVIIMLMQIIMIYGGRDIVQQNIKEKVERLKRRFETATATAKEAGADAAQDVLQPAT